jgi:anthranilate synthase component 1
MTSQEFAALAAQGYNRIPLVRQVLADLETPLSTYLKLGRGLHTYFFESVQGGRSGGATPSSACPVARCCGWSGRRSRWKRMVRWSRVWSVTTPSCSSPISSRATRWRLCRVLSVSVVDWSVILPTTPCAMWSRACWRGTPPKIGMGTPDILLMVSEEVVVFDNLRGTIRPDRQRRRCAGRMRWSVGRRPEAPGRCSRSAAAPVKCRCRRWRRRRPTALASGRAGRVGLPRRPMSTKASVEKVKDYVLAGDVMQVVIATAHVACRSTGAAD